MIETARSATSPSAPAEAAGAGVAETRLDPITGQWTVFAPHRDQRPDEFQVTRQVSSRTETCPFCRGHETDTPQPVWIGRVDEDDVQIETTGLDRCADFDWSVRVVPNKFPAVAAAAQPPLVSHPQRDHDLFRSRPLCGGHEVIIESPEHVESLCDLDLAEAALVFRAYQDRIRFWRRNPHIRYISVFKNVGGEAGASLRHSHSQLIAVDQMPGWISNLVDRMRRHQANTGCCLQCDLLRAEQKSRQRVIAQTDSLIAYCPFASRVPMLVRITTKKHQACFADLDQSTVEEVTSLLLRVVSWLQQIHPGTAYNHLLHTCPPRLSDSSEAFHWSLELFPRLTQIAGFEWSSQCLINPVLPEAAAALFRRCAAAENPRMVL